MRFVSHEYLHVEVTQTNTPPQLAKSNLPRRRPQPHHPCHSLHVRIQPPRRTLPDAPKPQQSSRSPPLPHLPNQQLRLPLPSLNDSLRPRPPRRLPQRLAHRRPGPLPGHRAESIKTRPHPDSRLYQPPLQRGPRLSRRSAPAVPEPKQRT